MSTPIAFGNGSRLMRAWTKGRAMKFAHLLLAAAVGAGAVSGAYAEPVKLGLTVQVAANITLGKNVSDYKTVVEQATGGEITFEIYDAAKKYVDFEVPGAVSSGAIEMGVAQLGLYAKEVPSVEIFQQPFLFDSDALTKAATQPQSEIRKLIDAQILRTTGTRVLWWQPYGGTVVMSKNAPIPNPHAMKDRNVRAIDPTAAEYVQLCGGKPHVISGSKMLDALKTGKVDAVMTGVSGVKVRELWRETQHVTKIRHSVIMFLVVINEKVWQSLPKQHQATMLKLAKKVESEYWGEFEQEEIDSYRFSTEKGMSISEISSDDLAEWRICSSDLVERFVDKLGATAHSLMSAYGRLRATTSCCNGSAAEGMSSSLSR
jgi:C4-dicarboxylate-binding protein DctP